MDYHLKNFGPRLRAVVEQRGTVESAYKAIGVSRATLFNWFNRDDPPPGRELVDGLSKWLGDDAQWVLDGVQTAGEPAADYGRMKSGTRFSPDEDDLMHYFSTVVHAAEKDPIRLSWLWEELRVLLEPRRKMWEDEKFNAMEAEAARQDVRRRIDEIKAEALAEREARRADQRSSA